MPIPGGGHYRVKTTASGAKIRLHFTQGGTVNEAKNLASGATHTPNEFQHDTLKKRMTTTRPKHPKMKP